MDLDLDAYADDANAEEAGVTKLTEPAPENAVEEKRVSVLSAAERAGIPLDVLLPKLNPSRD